MTNEILIQDLKNKISHLTTVNEALAYVLKSVIEIMEIHEKDKSLTAEEKVKLANSKSIITSGRMALSLAEGK